MTDDDNTFKELDPESDTAFGPPAILLIGFTTEQGDRVAALAAAHGLGDHRIIGTTTTMGSWTIARALTGGDDGKLLPSGELPHIVMLSGATDGQIAAVLDAYKTTDLPAPIFAVATPANQSFTVVQLLDELMAERAAMRS